jgi:hypothetical protein
VNLSLNRIQGLTADNGLFDHYKHFRLSLDDIFEDGLGSGIELVFKMRDNHQTASCQNQREEMLPDYGRLAVFCLPRFLNLPNELGGMPVTPVY